MTNFLPVAMIGEGLEDIVKKLDCLVDGLDSVDLETLKKELEAVKRSAEEILEFLGRFSCGPLIYTGKGTTEEVIERLEWLLAFAEAEGGSGLGSPPRSRKRKALNKGLTKG